ncbi:MAG: glycosyltransferase family 4 protein [Clostridia bacterium]|nr:glycosyltransferase family 4 protein [Clostridia bacterium]
MKLWIVSVGEPLPVDGVNTRLRRMGNLATFASRHGVEVEWFSVSFDHYKKIQRCTGNTDFQINDKFILHLVDSVPYKKNVSYARIKHHKQAGKAIYERMNDFEKPDVIIASMEPLEVSRAAVMYAKNNNVPCIVDVRDLWPEIYYDVIPKSLHWVLNFYVGACAKTLHYTMSNCDSIVGLSNGFLEYGLKYAKRERTENDAVYPIAYPNNDYLSYKNKLQESWGAYGIKETDFLVIFLGNFGDQFKFDEIIDAAKHFEAQSDIKFVLCGNGKHEDYVKSLVGENVIMPGWIEKEQIFSLMANASIGIAPYIDSMNYRLNTPNKFGEYLSAGLPIAVAVSGEMENLLGQYMCGNVYHNSKDLIDIIENYYHNEALLSQYSGNARKLYEDMFNADSMNEKLLSHIERISKLEKET